MMQIEGSIVSVSYACGFFYRNAMMQIEKFKRSTRPIDDDWSDEDEDDCQADKYDLPDPMLALRRGESLDSLFYALLSFLLTDE